MVYNIIVDLTAHLDIFIIAEIQKIIYRLTKACATFNERSVD